VSIRPRSSAAYNNLGLALSQQGKSEEAIAEFREALRLRSELPGVRINLGNALQDQGKLEEAIAEYRQALRLKPDYPEAHFNLGNALQKQGKLEEAIAEHRAALRLKPDLPAAHNNLGVALKDQGKLEEAIAEYREVLRLKPDFPEAHANLGVALGDQGKLEEAIAEHRAALRLKPDVPASHNNLGVALKDQGKSKEAIAEYRQALRLKPDYPEAHFNLGIALRSLGEFTDAIAALRKARDLAKTNPSLVQRVEHELAATELRASLAARLPAVLAGRLKPADAAEALGFAQFCYDKKLHGASARLWAEAFQVQPKLADDMQAQNRYNAACAAALAGCGQSKDDPPLDEAAKARWRKQAIDWLKADLTAWSNLLEKGPPQARKAIPETLQHWTADPDLAGLRDRAALAGLSADEQKACRALWAEVDALLAKAGKKATP
jgi:Flp pilus assembly protein TadD